MAPGSTVWMRVAIVAAKVYARVGAPCVDLLLRLAGANGPSEQSHHIGLYIELQPRVVGWAGGVTRALWLRRKAADKLTVL